MGFRLQQKLMTLNDLERQFTSVSSVMRVLTKPLKLESRGFRYKVTPTSATLSLTTKLKVIRLRPKLN